MIYANYTILEYFLEIFKWLIPIVCLYIGWVMGRNNGYQYKK
jgi:hypothetical protein